MAPRPLLASASFALVLLAGTIAPATADADAIGCERQIGDLPPAGGWVKLSVPVSAFGVTSTLSYTNEAVRCAGDGTVFWDRLGKKPGP